MTETKIDNAFWQKSYKNHKEFEKGFSTSQIASWKRLDTVDAWRHQRMYETILPLLKSCPTSSWMTIGDGRYGTDANYLLRQNIVNVLATDISDTLLTIAKSDGFIKDCKVENAEQLSFTDDSFDFILCKESYHHFPRPMIAFYEMLRVARDAIVIIEPNDVNLKTSTESKSIVKPKKRWQLTKDFLKDLFYVKRYEYHAYNAPSYETVGNYVYTVSEREFEKAALGLNLPFVAFKGMNDRYEEGGEFEPAEENSRLFRKVKNGICEMNSLCQSHGWPYNILVTVIFKREPQHSTLELLKTAGYRVKQLNRNPFI